MRSMPMCRWLLGLFLSCVCAFAQAQDRAAPSPLRQAGIIELAEGDSIIDPAGGTSFRPARAGEAVNEGDTLTTFNGAEVHLRMADGAYLSVRENSKITIRAYVADGGSGDRSLIELAKGSFRAITGWIGKFNQSSYEVRTPTATLGIRGTDHEPMHLLEGDPRGEPGTYDKVNEGGTFMRSAGGTVEVTPNRAAFHSSAPGARPRLLQSIPAFFRPARNEQRFVQRARATAPTIQRLRDTRIEAVRTERARNPAAPPAPDPRGPAPQPGARPDLRTPAAAPATQAAPRTELRRAQAPESAAAKAQAAREAAREAARKAAEQRAAQRAAQQTRPKPAAKKHPE
jgi:pyruvate/2-oxoglutarate dehydrogenase complex dihydrolipoamide acyltransferase (E2) component